MKAQIVARYQALAGRSGCDRARMSGLVFALGLSLVASSCGARVGPYLGAGAGVGQGGAAGSGVASQQAAAGTGRAGAASPGATSQVRSAGSAGTPGSAGVAGTAGTAGSPAVLAARTSESSASTFNFDPAVEAAACPNGQGNTSSDVGVTPSSITFGNVSGLTGPLANSFTQGAQAVQALFSAINAHGGICGRKLSLLVEDDGQSASHNAADVQDLIPKVLAFVGSTSDADNGGVPAMVHAGVPDIGFAINCNRSQSPVYWSPAGGSCYYVNGRPYYYNTMFNGLKAFGDFPKRMAFLAYNVPISAQAAQQFASMYQQSGGSVCYTDYSISPATASLAGDVIQMQNNHCDGVYTTLDVTGNAKLLQAMQQQQFHPLYAGTTFDGYTPSLISTAGEQASQGFQVGIPFPPFNGSNPIVRMYLNQLSAYEPGQQPSGFGFLAWAAAQMLVYALIKVGHNPTRQGITSVFNSLVNWNTGGALGPYTPRTRSVINCMINTVVKGTSFVRMWPSSGLYCNGQLVPVGP